MSTQQVQTGKSEITQPFNGEIAEIGVENLPAGIPANAEYVARSAVVESDAAAYAPPPLRLSKRLFDIVGSIGLFILLSPVFLVIMVAIRSTGKQVFFGHSRVGYGHETFRCYKFRSMVPDAEERLRKLLVEDPSAMLEWKATHKLKNDPRVTPIGAFLRKSSLDELPQLWNVLKGDMSLVGPRPIVSEELERYGNKAKDYCSVRPGMTGLWQILGRSNVTYSRRVSLDVSYVRKQGFWLDIWILFKTLGVVLRRVGAY